MVTDGTSLLFFEMAQTETARPKRPDRNGQTETARPKRPDRNGQSATARPQRPVPEVDYVMLTVAVLILICFEFYLIQHLNYQIYFLT